MKGLLLELEFLLLEQRLRPQGFVFRVWVYLDFGVRGSLGCISESLMLFSPGQVKGADYG